MELTNEIANGNWHLNILDGHVSHKKLQTKTVSGTFENLGTGFSFTVY